MSTASSSTRQRASAAAAAPSNEEDISLRLHKTLAEYNKNAANLERLAREAKEIAESHLNDFDERVNIKKRKIAEMEEDFKLQHKSRELEMLNTVKEGGYAKAIEILAARNPKEIAVSEVHYQALTNELAQLKQEMRQTIAAEVATHKQALDLQFKHSQETSGLKALTETAKIQALVEQREQHVKVLMDQIADLKKEVDAQRRLTQTISESFASAGKPTVVNSNGEAYPSSSRRG